MSAAAADRVVVADVVDRDITVDEVSAVVASDQDGAVVTFAGVVRDHDGGKGVTALEYERHPSAGDVIAAVARSIPATERAASAQYSRSSAAQCSRTNSASSAASPLSAVRSAVVPRPAAQDSATSR